MPLNWRVSRQLECGGFFDDADDRFVARGASAEESMDRCPCVVADRAFADFFFRVANCVGERKGLLAISAQQVEGEAAARFFWPMPGSCFNSSIRRFIEGAKSGIRIRC